MAKFSALSSHWWDVNGPFRILHEINPVRLTYIFEKIGGNLPNLNILDVGCGGGLISIPLARSGAKVTAIDASKENIQAAQLHAAEKNIKINFICTTAEEHKGQYDVVLCLELVEHVDNLDEFVYNLTRLAKPGGLIIFSTLNRTVKSYLLAIGAAEYILGWVPAGTHNFAKFIKPSALTKLLENNNITVSDIKGMSYNIINGSWGLSDDVNVNYFLSGIKNESN